MAKTGIYSSVLDQVDPQRVLRTEAEPMALRRRTGTVDLSSVPTNEEILKAAKATYAANSDAVDTGTQDGQTYVLTSPGHRQVATLNAYDWASQDAAPIAPTCQSVIESPVLASTVEKVDANPRISSVVIGISASAQFIIGGEGGIGVGRSSDPKSPTKGVGYAAGKLGLDIDVALNLQMGLWASDLAGLAGDFVGLEVNLDLEVGVSLGIYLHPKDLSYYGFSIGIGVGVGGGATVVGGYTWVF